MRGKEIVGNAAVWCLSGAVLLVTGCDGAPSKKSSDDLPIRIDDPSMSVQLNRQDDVDGLDKIAVTVELLRGSQPATGLENSLALTLPAGMTASDFAEIEDGIYQTLLTPSRTGEFEITVSENITFGLSETLHPVVLADVHEDWGQPMMVEGLVNTDGYEDGIAISPDGEYLFVQYSPAYFSGLILFNFSREDGGCGGDRLSPERCTHPWIDNTIGPVSAPERPDFYNARINSDGTWRHNSVSWGMGDDTLTLFSVSNVFYGFKRQFDGSYREPFIIAFDDEGDGISSPFGLSVLPDYGSSDNYLLALSFNAPDDTESVDFDDNGTADAESLLDIYTLQSALGDPINLGNFNYSDTPGTPPQRDSSFGLTKVGFSDVGIEGIAGTQGNPHLFRESSTVSSIWTDDEYDAKGPGSDHGELSVYVNLTDSYPSFSWQKVVLPAPVNLADPSQEIQPFFTGTELYFTRSNDTELPAVWMSKYSGAHTQTDFGNTALWATPVKVLAASSDQEIGNIIAIGEPTVGTIDGDEVMFFVYGVVRGFDETSGLADINMQAGYVRRND
ncbi:hypothetical protein [Thalassolituus maritimus]|uniref:Lipoprotein n=1 Tax=Thalassolituus maritimus TaxID=484498 RepID=A0ABQ0A331_9GAMM